MTPDEAKGKVNSQAAIRRALRRRLEEDLDAITTELQAVREERDRYLNLLKLIKGDLENFAPELSTWDQIRALQPPGGKAK